MGKEAASSAVRRVPICADATSDILTPCVSTLRWARHDDRALRMSKSAKVISQVITTAAALTSAERIANDLEKDVVVELVATLITGHRPEQSRDGQGRRNLQGPPGRQETIFRNIGDVGFNIVFAGRRPAGNDAFRCVDVIFCNIGPNDEHGGTYAVFERVELFKVGVMAGG